MTDPTNPGETPDPGAMPPPPPPAPPSSFPPPPPSSGFPPPTQPLPTVQGPDPAGPPPGPPPTSGRGKGPLLAAIAVVVLVLGAVGFFALSGGDDDKDAVSTKTTNTTNTTNTTATTEPTEPTSPGGKLGDQGDKEDEERPDTTAGDAQGYGDDPALDALYDDCEGGNYQACDDLYMQSSFGSDYEAFGDTCGERNEPSGYCVDVYSDSDGPVDDPEIDGTGATSYGDNSELDALYDDCEGGDYAACDQLYMESDFGSEYEEFGDTCGGRNEPSGYCVDVYADE